MFQQVVNDLQARVFGKKIKDANGQLVDTGVDELAQALSEALLKVSNGPLQISQPLKIVNTGTGPAIDIQQAGGSAAAITMAAPGGPMTSVGIGLGNQGIVANEFVPDTQYALPQESIQARYTSQGANGERLLGPVSGFGPMPSNVPPGAGAGEIGHGYKALPNKLPFLKKTTNTGAGAGAGGPAKLPVVGGGGGEISASGATIHRGSVQAVPTVGFASLAEFFGNLRVIDGNLVGRINNMPIYLGMAAPAGGLTTSVTVVTAVSCTAGALSVTDGDLAFTNGSLTGVT